MLRALASRVLTAGLMLGMIGFAAESQAASVLLATLPKPNPDADAVNAVIDGLNAGGADLISGVTDLGKFKLDKSEDFDRKIVYFATKGGGDAQLFGFINEKGKQIALLPEEFAKFADSQDLSKAVVFGRQRPIPEPASMLLLLAGGALVARATRKSRAS